jgi:hypothetical protein
MTEKEFLEELKTYIEDVEVKMSMEWGSGDLSDELIRKGLMPEVYTEVVNRLDAVKE